MQNFGEEIFSAIGLWIGEEGLFIGIFAAHTTRYAQFIFPAILFANIICARHYRQYHLHNMAGKINCAYRVVCAANND
jgi:hypothetical protein